jgi:uncharacterized delta-60 repeat protein
MAVNRKFPLGAIRRDNRPPTTSGRPARPLLEALEPRQLLSSVPSLDPTFNGTGEVLDNWAGGQHAAVTGVKVLPSGQIIAVGQGIPTGGTNQELFVARFNSDGSPDNTFNASAGTNYQFYNPFNDGLDDYANGIVLLSDGSFIVSGSNGNESTDLEAKGYIFKFTAAGSLDPGFGTNGSYTDPVQSIASVAAQGDDLLIGGVAGTTQFAISRLTADGQLDTSFGNNGRVLFTASAVTSDSPSANSASGLLSVRDDGSFVYSGVVGPQGSRSGFVANYTAQGTLAAAFGSTSGELLLSYGGDDSAGATLRPDGGLLVQDGQFQGISSITYYVGGISSTGTQTALLDVGQLDFPNSSYVWAYGGSALQSDGDLILAEYTAGGNSDGPYNTSGGQAVIWRTDSTLDALDPSFGSSGEFSLLDGSGGGLFPNGISLTPDGQLLIAGFADVNGGSDSIMLARYDINPGTGNISGSVFNDLSLNGTEDPGEALANVPVYVDLTDAGQFVEGDPTTTTDAFGNYSLTGLAPGTYTVRVNLSLLPTLGIESPAAGAYTVTVTAGGTVSGENFALAATPTPSPTPVPTPTPTVTGAVIYVSDSTDNLFTANTATGQVTDIGNMGVQMFDIAENAQGQLYGVDSSSDLDSINPTTAAVTPVGPLGTTVNSLAFSPQGTLYGANDSLFTISTSTGAATLVGSLGGPSSDGDLAFDNEGNLFLSTTANDLANVNTTTGEATDIGPIGASGIYGLAFGSDGVMYGVSTTTGQVFAINLSTGSGTLVSTLPDEVDAVLGAASAPFAPAASTTSLTASATSINTGSALTLTAAVAAATMAATPPTGTVDFLENGATIGSAPLQSDGTAVFSTTSLPSGTASITAVYSGDESFAASTSAPLTEVVTPPSTVVPVLTGFKLPSAVIAGAKLKIRVPVVLTNRGATTKGAFTVRLYVDGGTTLNGSQVLLATVSKDISLKAGQGKVVVFALNSLPSTLPAGAYYVLAQVTDPTGKTGLVASSGTVTVAPPFVALSGAISVAGAVKPGKSASAVATVANGGNIQAAGALEVALSARPAGTSGSADLALQTVAVKVKIKPGGTSRVRLRFLVPSTLAAGTYSLVAQLDPNNAFGESALPNPIVSATTFTVVG